MRQLTAMFALLPGVAAANPSFKQVPGGGSKQVPSGDGGGISYEMSGEINIYEWVDWGMQFLADNWHYLGIVYVCLVLYLFVKGPDKKKAGPPDEVFFDEGYKSDVPYR